MKRVTLLGVLVSACLLTACDSGSTTTSTNATTTSTATTNPTTVTGSTDPNFTIVNHSDAGFSGLNRKVVVFDIPIYAASGVEDQKLLHAANIMAQYLDNDEDGAVDNPAVLNAMQSNMAFMVMWKKEGDLSSVGEPPAGRLGQDLGADETVPAWHTNGQTGRFDASLEEVWHIITHAGYASAYADEFGEYQGTSLTNAMDLARGGQFTTVPTSYPANAWYSYGDTTCTYNCMATEYFYWAMSSMLGAQKNRFDEISDEWKLNTRALVESRDPAMFTLLTNSRYHFPSKLPDGSYRH